MYLPNHIEDVDNSNTALSNSILGLKADSNALEKVHQASSNGGASLENSQMRNSTTTNDITEGHNINNSQEDQPKIENCRTLGACKEATNGIQIYEPSRGIWVQSEGEVIADSTVSNKTMQIRDLKNNFLASNSVFIQNKEVQFSDKTQVNIDEHPESTEKPNEEAKSSPKEKEARIKHETLNFNQISEEPIEELCCRVCLESEENAEIGKLIAPCRCTGSMKWIHDECLKTWIVSRNRNIKKASCELCHTVFNMQFKFEFKFHPRAACREGKKSLLSCIFLSLILLGLLVLIAYVGITWNWNTNQGDGDSQQGNSLSFKLAITVVCSMISVLLGALVVAAIRDAFYVTKVKEWNFLSPNLTNPRVIQRPPHDSPFHEEHDENSPRSELSEEPTRHQQPTENPRHAVEYTTTQVENTTQPIVTEIKREETGLDRTNLDVEAANVLNNISQYNDVNCSRFSEAILLNTNAINTTIHNLTEGVETEAEKTKPKKIKLLQKNHSANTILNSAQAFWRRADEATNEQKKIQPSNSELNIRKQSEEHNDIKKPNPTKPTLQKGFTKKDSVSQFKQSPIRDHDEEKKSKMFLFREIPKEFLRKSQQGSNKMIEVVIDTENQKIMDGGKNDNNSLFKVRVIPMNGAAMIKNSSEPKITANLTNSLKKNNTSAKLEIFHQTPNS